MAATFPTRAQQPRDRAARGGGQARRLRERLARAAEQVAELEERCAAIHDAIAAPDATWRVDPLLLAFEGGSPWPS